MKELSQAQKDHEAELVAVCRKYSGEYLPSHHGKGSWATTYSNEFVSAATDLCQMYRDAGYITEYDTVLKLYITLRDNRIPSCRGGIFNFDTALYLYRRPIFRELRRRELFRTA